MEPVGKAKSWKTKTYIEKRDGGGGLSQSRIKWKLMDGWPMLHRRGRSAMMISMMMMMMVMLAWFVLAALQKSLGLNGH